MIETLEWMSLKSSDRESIGTLVEEQVLSLKGHEDLKEYRIKYWQQNTVIKFKISVS